MKKHLRYLAVGLIIMWGCSSEAARPFATDDTGIVEREKHELEAGYTWGEGDGAFELGFKHGLTERMDIGVGFGYTVETKPEECFTPAELSLKFALAPDLFSVSFAHEFGEAAYDINLIFTRVLGPIEIDANLGYSATGDDEKGLMTYAVALILATGEKFDIGAELLGDETDVQNLLVGARYHIKEGFSLDMGFSKGLGDDIKDTITVGLHYEF